jgi:hypothetical protein
MSGRAPDKSEAIVPFAPAPQAAPARNIVADDSGRTIIALLQKAAGMAKDDCARAMDVAHKLSFQLHAAEERAREAEAEVARFRERANRAEAWLLRIQSEAEQIFFPKRDGEARQAPSERNAYAPKPRG